MRESDFFLEIFRNRNTTTTKTTLTESIHLIIIHSIRINWFI
jgi:hypothetical protein